MGSKEIQVIDDRLTKYLMNLSRLMVVSRNGCSEQ
jgi:hypothetical protein